MSVVRAFLDGNRRASLAVAGVWPRRPDRVEVLYCTKAAEAIRRRPNQLVADVGGGKTLRYAEYLKPGDAHIIAVDIADEELVGNDQVAETRVADVTRHLPFENGEVDVLTSSSVLEHLPDLGGFLDEAARVVKTDGIMVHVFPSGYAPFAILNRVLPERVKRWVLFRTYPESEGFCGFPAFYDRCYYSAFVRECERRGFRIESATAGYYGSSAYFSICLPLFIVCRLWEWSASTLGARNLASQLVVEARRLPD